MTNAAAIRSRRSEAHDPPRFVPAEQQDFEVEEVFTFAFLLWFER